MPDYVSLLPGDPAPWFRQRATTNPSFVFDTSAGRYLVLCFFGSAGDPQSRAALDAVQDNRRLFDDSRIAFFGVTLDPQDEARARIAESLPGIRFFWDFDGKISRLYGSIPNEGDPRQEKLKVRRFWIVLDPTLRVHAAIPFASDGSDRARLFDLLAALPPPNRFAGSEVFAPVLVLPQVFEPALCEELIGAYKRTGGFDSGFMREVEGRTVEKLDHHHKRRRDYIIEDETLRAEIQARFKRRVISEIRKIHHFDATRMERYVVSCYAAEERGHFRPHRDNTTKGTAHRRFAVSINLNADFDGGQILFPEYGNRSYKPGIGGAVVFSCSMLHAVSEVTRGRRFAFLPFLYDEAAARDREANNQFLADDLEKYRDNAPLE